MRLSVRADSKHPPGKRETDYATTLQKNGAEVSALPTSEARRKCAHRRTGFFLWGLDPVSFWAPSKKKWGRFPLSAIRKHPFRLPGLFGRLKGDGE